jgi:hypothetical protein
MTPPPELSPTVHATPASIGSISARLQASIDKRQALLAKLDKSGSTSSISDTLRKSIERSRVVVERLNASEGAAKHEPTLPSATPIDVTERKKLVFESPKTGGNEFLQELQEMSSSSIPNNGPERAPDSDLGPLDVLSGIPESKSWENVRTEAEIDEYMKNWDALDAEINPQPTRPKSEQKQQIPGPSSESEVKDALKKLTPMSRTDVSDAQGENFTESQEEIEQNSGFLPLAAITDAVAIGTARGLAKVAPKPTQAPVSGYLGNRNVNNEDVANSSATGTADPSKPRGGDAFLSAKESHNSSTDTLRPTFGIAPANGVVPSKRAQLESDILFNDFSVVAPGHGLGVTNKMFLMEEAREKKIVYREPLAEPRKYDGPTDGVVAPPLEWQNEITRRDRNILAARAIAEQSTGALLEARAGAGSLNILGDDYGMLQRTSDKGLKRPRESPMEPIIRLPKAWERVRPLPGVQWARKQTRRLFDALRYPERFESNIAQEGGPIMGKRNALAVFPFPLST